MNRVVMPRRAYRQSCGPRLARLSPVPEWASGSPDRSVWLTDADGRSGSQAGYALSRSGVSCSAACPLAASKGTEVCS